MEIGTACWNMTNNTPSNNSEFYTTTLDWVIQDGLCFFFLFAWRNWKKSFSQTSPSFYVSAVQFFWKKEKKELLAKSNFFFLPPPPVFFIHLQNFYHLHQIWNCSLQTHSVWKSLKLDVWERVKRELFQRMDRLSDSPAILDIVLLFSRLTISLPDNICIGQSHEIAIVWNPVSGCISY